jgi:hypothetical protein
MAVPSNPKLTDVYTEFGAPVNTPLSAFLRGGAYVPNGPAANAGVPTALPIKLSQLAGAVKYVPMTVTVANVSGATTVGVSNDTIGSAAVNVSNGQSPFTYSTVHKSGTSFTISSATTNHPTFIRAGNPTAGSVSGIYTVTVTDATSASVSKDFTVTDNRGGV